VLRATALCAAARGTRTVTRDSLLQALRRELAKDNRSVQL